MEPMLATLAEAPLVDPNLVYEPKYDGIRALISVVPRGRSVEVTIASRQGNDKTKQFPEVVEALDALGEETQGRCPVRRRDRGAGRRTESRSGSSGFRSGSIRPLLREVARLAGERPVAFVAFDLLRDGGDDLVGLPLAERRGRLEAALRNGVDSTLRMARQVRGDGTALMDEARRHSWEGIVAKDARSTYKPGRRTLDWRKLKLVKRQELVVGGFTEPRGARAAFRRVAARAADRRTAACATPGTSAAASPTRSWRMSGRLLKARADGDVALRRAAAGQREAALGPPGAGRRGEVRGVDHGRLPAPAGLPRPARRSGSWIAERRGETARSASSPAALVKGPVEERGAAEGRARWPRSAPRSRPLAARGSGKLELPGGAVLELGNLRQAALARARPHQGRSLPLLPGGLAVSAAGGARPAAGHEAIPRRHRGQRLLPAARARAGAARRAQRAGRHRRRRAGAPGRRRSGHAAAHGAAGGDLPGPLVLPRAIAARDGLRGDRSRSRWPRRRSRACATSPAGCTTSSRRWGSRAGSRPPARAACTSSCRCAPAPRTSRGCFSARSSPRSWSTQHPEAATVERTVNKRDPEDRLHRLPAEHQRQDAGLRLQRARQRLRRARRRRSPGTSSTTERQARSARLHHSDAACARCAEVGDLWAGLRQAPGIDLEAALERAQGRQCVDEIRRSPCGKSSAVKPTRRPFMRSKISLVGPARSLAGWNRCRARATTTIRPRGTSRSTKRPRASPAAGPLTRQDRDHAGDLHLRALRQAGAGHRGELRRPGPRAAALEGPQERQVGQEALLRRPDLPPRHPELHDPGRRSAGHRAPATRATASTDEFSPTSSSTSRLFWPWPTPARPPTARSSSSPRGRPSTSPAATPSSACAIRSRWSPRSPASSAARATSRSPTS